MIESTIAFWSSLWTLAFGSADPPPPEPSEPPIEHCGQSPQHWRASVRYTTPKGIGYKTGYTTLETFFSPKNLFQDAWLPFFDGRLHVFDNGKVAANTGLGLRYLSRSRVWGIHSFYDYRNTSHQHYNQVSAGLETLGRVWDFRIDGYLPVGQKQIPFSRNTRFYAFQGHHLLLQRSRKFAMKGANTEAGFHVDHFKKTPLYFAGGSYYLTGQGQSTWGGELRARIDYRCLRLEGNVSYDHFFKWIGQAQISIHLPFGGRNQVIKKDGQSCSQAMTLQTRVLQKIDRHEIIPVAKQHIIELAINPATGQPWIFWFVNNTSSSDGTYESPYPSLMLAQMASSPEEAIYVYPGDGTTRGMNEGITLQDAQLLFGASITHPLPTTVGTILIPPLASSLPTITNTGNVVTLANDNTVSGFSIPLNAINQNGITGNGISNLIADQNTIVTTTTDTNGINLLNPVGQILITNSSFNGFMNQTSLSAGNGVFVEMQPGNTLSSLNFEGNTFSNINAGAGNFGGNGILANLAGGAIMNIQVFDCAFINITNPDMHFGGNGIFANVQTGTIDNLTIVDSAFNNLNTGSNGISALFSNVGSAITNMNVLSNTFSGIANRSNGTLVLFPGNGTIANLNVLENSFSNITNASIGFNFITLSSSVDIFMNVSGNEFTGDSSDFEGYGASIEINEGTACLEFLYNTASPANSPIPYNFLQTITGQLNRTTGSDTMTNTGQFNIVGGVGAPGSCSE